MPASDHGSHARNAGLQIAVRAAWRILPTAMLLFLTSAALASECLFLKPNEAHQFHATGAGNTDVVWMVDSVPGGAPTIGIIDDQGRYIAPANVDRAVDVTVTAASANDSGGLESWAVCNEVFVRAGDTHHVATVGSDTDQGTSDAPWRTIQHAVDQAEPGDTILVHGGVYNEAVMITRSGSADGGYITLAEAPGESAVIDGTGLVRQPFGMRGLITLADVSYVRVKDFEIRDYKSDSEFIVIGVLVQGAGERIEIRDNVIHRIEANNVPTRGNANGLGIAVYGQTELPLRNIIVDGNELFNLKTGRSEALTIGGNVEGWQVTNNIVRDNDFIGIDATGYYVNGAEYDRARRGWIAGNAVYNLSSAGNRALTVAAAAVGIYVDGGHNITIERNRVEANDGGIWLLSEHPGKNTSNVLVRNNLVRFNRDAGILVGGYDEAQSGGANECTIVHNTLLRNNSRDVSGIHSGELQIGHHASDIRFEDNILLAGPKGYVITRFSPAKSRPVTIGHNHYSASAGSDRTRWFWVDRNFYNDGRAEDDFDAFKAASGDEGSVIEEPDVLDVNGPEWRWTAN